MARQIDLTTHTDNRGNLTVIEKVIPFDIKRIFWAGNIKYYGVLVYHRAEKYLKSNDVPECRDIKAPLKSGEISHCVFTWYDTAINPDNEEQK